VAAVAVRRTGYFGRMDEGADQSRELTRYVREEVTPA
jgi:hypothetical protein